MPIGLLTQWFFWCNTEPLEKVDFFFAYIIHDRIYIETSIWCGGSVWSWSARNTLPHKKCRLKLWSTIFFLPLLSPSSSRRFDAFYFLVRLALGRRGWKANIAIMCCLGRDFAWQYGWIGTPSLLQCLLLFSSPLKRKFSRTKIAL
jgi:hypothetical protein